jgi:hypothetical protein
MKWQHSILITLVPPDSLSKLATFFALRIDLLLSFGVAVLYICNLYNSHLDVVKMLCF